MVAVYYGYSAFLIFGVIGYTLRSGDDFGVPALGERGLLSTTTSIHGGESEALRRLNPTVHIKLAWPTSLDLRKFLRVRSSITR